VWISTNATSGIEDQLLDESRFERWFMARSIPRAVPEANGEIAPLALSTLLTADDLGSALAERRYNCSFP
jgi:hypothetical protein